MQPAREYWNLPMISVLDLYKIGIGPSSSHTVGPMIAARRFVKQVESLPDIFGELRLRVELFGSLAWTGKGHGTDVAIILGLCGESPATVDPDQVGSIVANCKATRRIALAGR